MNPASRILAIYDKAMHFPVDNSVSLQKLWGSVLRITDQADHTHEDEITAALMALRDEINLAMTRLSEAGYPSQLFVNYFNRIKGVTSPTLLTQPWAGQKAGLQNDIRLALEWAAWSLPDEEDEIPAEEVNSLIAELDAIEKSISDTPISPHTSAFIVRQIDLIRAALRVYSINGIAPVEKALEQSIGAFTRSTEIVRDLEVAESAKSGLWKRLRGTITNVADIADKVDKIRKGGSALKSIGIAVHAAYDNVINLLPPPH